MEMTKKLAMNSSLLLLLSLSVIILATHQGVHALGAPDLELKSLHIDSSGSIVVTAVAKHTTGILDTEKKGCIMPCPNGLIPAGICTKFDCGEYTEYEDEGCCLSCCVPGYC